MLSIFSVPSIMRQVPNCMIGIVAFFGLPMVFGSFGQLSLALISTILVIYDYCQFTFKLQVLESV
jgi:hypothetical protein